MKATKAYSLIEILLVIAIMTTAAVAGSIFLFGQKTQTDLEEERIKIVDSLRAAQNKAMTGEQGSSWGIHFDNSQSSSPFYDVFWGTSYSLGTTTDRAYLPESVIFQIPQAGNATDTIFIKRAGNLAAGATTTITLQTLNLNQTSSIIVAPNGRVTTR